MAEEHPHHEPHLHATLPGICRIPTETMDQIAGELCSWDLGNLRRASTVIHSQTIYSWNKRVLEYKDGLPPLEWAAGTNQPSLIDYILTVFSGIDVNTPREGHRNPLGIACKFGNNEAARALIQNGADINYVSPNGFSILLEASCTRHHTTVQMLLELGADAQFVGYGDCNIIHYAAQYNQTDTLRVILAWKQANPDSMPDILAFNATGGTALHMACLNEGVDTVELMLGNGFDVDLVSSGPEYQTPLTWTAGHAYTGQGCEMLDLLLSNGANVEGRSAHNQNLQHFDTPLHIAIRRSRHDLAKALIGHGASMEALSARGEPTLHTAVRVGDLDMVKLIVEEGGNVNMVDAEGSFAVHALARDHTAHYFSFTTTMYLRDQGAEVFLENSAGEFPQALAIEAGWPLDAVEAVWGMDSD